MIASFYIYFSMACRDYILVNQRDDQALLCFLNVTTVPIGEK